MVCFLLFRINRRRFCRPEVHFMSLPYYLQQALSLDFSDLLIVIFQKKNTIALK